jgi:hypothetical protein
MPTRIRGHLPSTKAGITILIASMGTLLMLIFEFVTENSAIASVNVGGWFVLEPFISPALYQKYSPANDEWKISVAMAADTAGGGLNQLEDHYKTFIVSRASCP